MNKKFIYLAILSGVMIFTSIKLRAQTAGDYRSIQTGNWNDVANWQIYVNSTGWTAATTKPGSSRNVTIQTGHTITLDASNSCNNLTVQSGAVLKSAVSAANAYYLRLGTTNANVVVQNDGLIGSTTNVGDGIILEAAGSTASVLIQGAGICQVARLRAVSGNTNNFSMTIDQNIVLTVPGAAAFTAYYNNSASATTDNYTLTINAGKTVSLASGTGAFHLSSGTTSNSGGKYTYNINGILDLSASTAQSYIVPLSTNATSTVTVNVKGLIKLGSGGLSSINASPSGTTDGKIVFNIENGGLVDATNTDVLAMGTNFFTTSGTGALKRKVGSTDVIFPVGIATAAYNPVILHNTGADDNFTVSVKNTFDYALADVSKVVNRQWTINSDNSGSNAVISLGWLTADQAENFNPAGNVSIIRYNGTAWEEASASISGNGNVNTPYQATGDIAHTLFGVFAVRNSTTLPLNFTSFGAKLAPNGDRVNLSWATANEMNTSTFEIERAVEGSAFQAIGSMPAKNTLGAYTYTFTDNHPQSGVNYYRIKQLDIDGKYTYSDVKSVNNEFVVKSISLYPNPTLKNVTVTHPVTSKPGEIKIINTQGKQVNSQLVTSGSITTTTDVSALVPGVYVLFFKADGKTNSTTFIKQ